MLKAYKYRLHPNNQQETHKALFIDDVIMTHSREHEKDTLMCVRHARQCMSTLTRMFACPTDALTGDGDALYLDLGQSTELQIPYKALFSSLDLIVYQSNNLITFKGVTASIAKWRASDDEIRFFCDEYNDAYLAVGITYTGRKAVVLDIDDDCVIRAECKCNGEYVTNFDVRDSNDLASYIYGQIHKDYETIFELACMLRKAMKMYELKHENDVDTKH